jgi:dihydroflavonol-4-reductase
MTVVVTGATGHLGSNLVRSLITRRPVRALVHNREKGDSLDGLDLDRVFGDVGTISSLYTAFDGADVVYHLAANVSFGSEDWALMESVNVVGVRNVVEACLHCGVRRLVYFSCVHALVQEPLLEPVNELRPLVESSNCPAYDRSKALGEREVRNGIEMGLDAIIINPSGMIGPYDFHLSQLGRVLVGLANHKLPALVGSGLDWVDVRDVSAGAIRAEEQAPTGAKFILSGHWASMSDVAAIVERLTGVRAPRLVVPAWLAHAGQPVLSNYNRWVERSPVHISSLVRTFRGNKAVRHERATRELDYNPVSLQQTVNDALRWYQENGRIIGDIKLQVQGQA